MKTKQIPHKCPVCNGTCKNASGEKCKACVNGIVWGTETDDYNVPVIPQYIPTKWEPFCPPKHPYTPFPYDGITWTISGTNSLNFGF